MSDMCRFPLHPYGRSSAILATAYALLGGALPATGVELEKVGPNTVVTGKSYRLTFREGFAGYTLELKDAGGGWRKIGSSGDGLTHGLLQGSQEIRLGGMPGITAASRHDGIVTAAQTALPAHGAPPLLLRFVCHDEGVLMDMHLAQREPGISLWPVPRIALEPEGWQAYCFWDADGLEHRGDLRHHAGDRVYAGVTTWGTAGDIVPALDSGAPGFFVAGPAGLGLGVVFVRYAVDWKGVATFLQRYNERTLLFYPAIVGEDAGDRPRWAWLVPAASLTPGLRDICRRLAEQGETLTQAFNPETPPVPDEWTRPLPPFPETLRRSTPVTDIREAIVFTMAETTRSRSELEAAAAVGSEVLIRAWFKWNEAPRLDGLTHIPEEARRMGALFGGGITCSALYDTENGITREQLLDMATRGPDGRLVDAWGLPGVRHGSLSSPAYLDYLFRWCREQIDAGVDMLFMDEHTAALNSNEGYDDHSMAAFRQYLMQKKGWPPKDSRWQSVLSIPLTDPTVCPDGTMQSFDYRGFLKVCGHVANPLSAANPLSELYLEFRKERDLAAWRTLTQRIREYAASRGRRILISANGFAPYVDLQVAGTWNDGMIIGQGVDLAEDAIPRWRSRVLEGWRIAGKRVPVVFFHDWGVGEPPFPFMSLPPQERALWIRVRAPEIFAAGGFFAFPVLGPFGCDARADGTLPTIQKQTIFYRTHRDLFLRGEYLGAEGVQPSAGDLSLAVWRGPDRRTLLVHVINRRARNSNPVPRDGLRLRLPVRIAPRSASAISPDWSGERPVPFNLRKDALEIVLPVLEAYAVVQLRFSQVPDASTLTNRARVYPALLWERPSKGEFVVSRDGSIEDGALLNGYLQGRLHTHLRRPPTFLVHALAPATLRLKVKAVAATGARLRVTIHGRTLLSVDLPDRDGKNDATAPEYDRVFEVRIPAGKHRVALDNDGPDWLSLAWLEWTGKFR